jgi:hypothetical protein
VYALRREAAEAPEWVCHGNLLESHSVARSVPPREREGRAAAFEPRTGALLGSDPLGVLILFLLLMLVLVFAVALYAIGKAVDSGD